MQETINVLKAISALIVTGLVAYALFTTMRHVREWMVRTGKGPIGAFLAELGVIVGGGLIFVIAIRIIFGFALPQGEQDFAELAPRSVTGTRAYNCWADPLGNGCLGAENAASLLPGATTTDPNAGTSSDQRLTTTETTTSQTTQSGAPDPGLFLSNDQVAKCVARWLSSNDIENRTVGDRSMLPADSNWQLISPNWGGHVFSGEGSEVWTLTSKEWPVMTYSISGSLARSMGGKVTAGQNRETTNIKGTGPLPESCWSYASGSGVVTTNPTTPATTACVPGNSWTLSQTLSWTQISQACYSDPYAWTNIFNANPGLQSFTDPNALIPAGTGIVVPAR